MKPAVIALTVLAVVGGAACKRKAAGSGAGGAAVVVQDAAVPLVPFTGKLTVDRVMSARNLVNPFDPWETGFARLQALVGAPTRIDGARRTWAVIEGDTCAYFYVTQENGADFKVTGLIVGTVQAPTRAGPDGAARADCLTAAGVVVAPPDDPSVPGPPTDGSVVPLATLRAAAIPARPRWQGQKIKVAAVLGSVTTATSDGDAFVTVALVEGPKGPKGTDDALEPLSCTLPKNQTAPPDLAGQAVIATGTVRIDEWHSLGEAAKVTLKTSLADCSVTAAK